MVRMLARCGDNVNLAVRRFQEEFGVSVSHRTMLAATQRLRDHGTFTPRSMDRGGPDHLEPEMQERILDYFHEHPTASTRQAGRLFGISHMAVWRVLKNDNQHPFHYRRCQELNPLDYEPRVAFSEWLLQDVTRNILWTDECTFTRRGLFNQHNRHMWAHENPMLMEEDSFQHRFSLNVWAGIIGPYILGPIFLRRLTGEAYLEFLQVTLPQLIIDLLDTPNVPLAAASQIYYQHDGAPAHFVLNVRRHLDEEYGTRWIGRGGPVQWPARSPDLTPLDFFLWGRIKALVYDDGNGPTNVNELRNKIISAFQQVKSDTQVLESLRNELRRRAVLCIQQRGRHFESLLQQLRNL